MSGEAAEGLVERRTVSGELIERLARPPLAAALGLEPHPEGGWYRRTWAADTTVVLAEDGATRRRPLATLIVFLLPVGEASAWHRVSSDEVWIWSGVGPIELQRGGEGETPEPGEVVVLGDAGEGLTAQCVIPAGQWQRTLPADHDALASCIVAPGFDFDDFELADQAPSS
ncbi:MAG: cupin domain-containing protein [Microbacterium sp.]